MLYRFLKVYVRTAMFFFCRVVRINRPEILKIQGPVLLACNHPNSFLDAIILDILFDQPLWSLARGDAFRSPRLNRILKSLRIMPVYRTSEGVRNLSENYNTFDSCVEIFRTGGQVVIFSEGKCVNEWHLRPLKKGTARLAMQAWQQGIDLVVLPVGINYSSFRRFGKNVFLHFGNPITRRDVDLDLPDGTRNQLFNQLLKQELERGVMEIPRHDRQQLRTRLVIRQPLFKKILLALPALAGIIIHFPWYYPVKRIAGSLNKSDHYDSILTGLVFLTYPFYLLLLTAAVAFAAGLTWACAILLILPFCGWSAMQLKPQLDK